MTFSHTGMRTEFFSSGEGGGGTDRVPTCGKR